MSTIFKALFTIDRADIGIPAISIPEKVSRTVLVYVFLIVALRIAGKREMARMNAFDGPPEVLILNGRINYKRLGKELITPEELKSAAHKQGEGNLADVEKAEIGANGELLFIRRAALPEETRQHELIAKLDALRAEVAELRDEMRGK
jgi:uncharacterized membrane protein YcaP (DUF421 family)